MKKNNLFGLIIVVISSLSFTKKSVEDTDILGMDILNAIQSEHEEKLLNLIVTKEEIIETIDNSKLSDTIKNSFKLEFISILDEKNEKTKMQIISGYRAIKEDISKKKCEDSVEMGKTHTVTNKLKNLPIELGNLEIEYKCNKKKSIISVEIINTLRGWRILEKLRLKGKEKR